ncbi:hypothetical protein [Vibrio pectenicida]|uniref:Uncharacterized protein n=1 Tax=Vibrio pectenicida TaxID=62763 RepID=A0A427TRN3_9VIBR|nr:hypothetical protein [Vibrio pectenicida]RSD26942.1 hypothetical protein EJA03_20000 [Vibrio pectenicida]
MPKKLRMQQTLILFALVATGYGLIKLLCPNHQHCYGDNLWHADFDGARLLIDANQSDVMVFKQAPEHKFKTSYKRHSVNLDGRHAFTFSKQQLFGEYSSYQGIKDSILSIRFVDLYNSRGNCLVTLQVNDKLSVLELKRVN